MFSYFPNVNPVLYFDNDMFPVQKSKIISEDNLSVSHGQSKIIILGIVSNKTATHNDDSP